MKIITSLLLFSIISNLLLAEGRIIKGTVYSIDTNWTNKSKKAFTSIDTNRFPGVSICLLENLKSTQKGTKCKISTYTDIDGSFEIEIMPNIGFLEIQAAGYKPQIINLAESGNPPLGIILIEEDILIPLPDNIPKVNKESFVYKPAIYLYPPTETSISIHHNFKGTIGTTYPDYKNGWNVKAQPDGIILNLADNRKYEYLFWDGSCTFSDEHFAFKDGFVVPKKDLTNFLLSKLSLIGLNNKEMNDFIVYWLPMLNKNEINFIHFRINDNIDNASVLDVKPKPDSWLRLFMEYKEADNDFTIPEQKLKSYPRNGFTLVEWGGSKIEQILKIL